MISSRLQRYLDATKNTLIPFPALARLKDQRDLDKLEENHFSESKKNSKLPDAAGAFKIVKFGKSHHVAVTLENEAKDKTPDDKPTDIELAYVYPQEEIFPEQKTPSKSDIEHFNDAVIFMLTRGVPDDFNLLPLYHDTNGRAVYLKGQCDLRAFITSSHIASSSLADVRNFIADIVMGIFDLHSRDLVHRDIKSNNILLFPYKNQIFLKIIDHDELVTINKFNRLIGRDRRAGSYFCAPPDAKSTNYFAGDLDLKSVDLYCLGYLILNEILPRLKNGHIQKELKKHFGHLTNHFPSFRGTIQELMKSDFFGETPDMRAAFFAERRKQASRKITFDGIPTAPAPKLDDPVLLLDQTIKPIYQAANELAEEIANETMRRHKKTDKLPDGLAQKLKRLELACEEKHNPDFDSFVFSVLRTSKQSVFPFAEPDVTATRDISLLSVKSAFEDYKKTVSHTVTLPQCCLFKKTIPNPNLTEASAFVAAFTQAVARNEDATPLLLAFLRQPTADDSVNSFRNLLQSYFKDMDEDVRKLLGFK